MINPMDEMRNDPHWAEYVAQSIEEDNKLKAGKEAKNVNQDRNIK